MPRLGDRSDHRRSRSCPATPGVERLGLWCTMAGHWRVGAHLLEDRIMDEMVLLYCVDGGGWLRLGQEHYSVGPGDLLICPMRIRHGYGAGPEGWEIWWAQFCGAQAARLCAGAGLLPERPVASPRDGRAVGERFGRLLAAVDTREPDRAWHAAEALHGLLCELVRQAAPGVRSERSLAALADETCAGLDDLVRRSGLSKHHLCRRFREETGQSPWQYVLERKMEKARELLVGTNLPVKEIAAAIGFENPDYFARRFRRHTGATPNVYRGR